MLRSGSGIRSALCDGEPARLIGLWEGEDQVIVVDAVRGDEPGRIHELSLAAVRDHPGGPSSHALGLGAAVELAVALDRMPRRLVVLAVEAAEFGFGTGLTPPVAAAVPLLTARIAALAAGGQADTDAHTGRFNRLG